MPISTIPPGQFHDEGAEGGEGGAAPVLDSLSPASATIGDPVFEVHCIGSGFTAESIIVWGGGDEPTDFISDTDIHTTVNTAVMLNPAVIPVKVRNVDGTESAEQTFEVLAAGTRRN